MEKPILSPAGVTEKTNELYALTNSQLNAEVTLINSGLIDWITLNFRVSADQEAFLRSLSPEYLAALTEQVSRAVSFRWPIIFEAELSKAAPQSAKWVHSKEEDEAGDGGANIQSEHRGVLHIQTGH